MKKYREEIKALNGEVATEVWDCFGGIWEPVEKWIICDNCHGLGEVEKDEF